MMIVTIASYIVLITLLGIFASRVLWLFLGLFTFRFLESFINIDFVHKLLPNFNEKIYYVFIIILTVVIYFTILAFTRELPFVKYIILFLLAIYVLSQPDYGLKEVFLFKDYLENNGMWSLDYWTGQIKQLFSVENNLIVETFTNVIKGFVNFVKGLTN